MLYKRLLNIFFIFFIIGTLLCLNGCGFHPLSASSVPQNLRTLYLETPNEYSQFTQLLTMRLKALNIHLTNSAKQAPITLRVDNIKINRSEPSIITNSIASTYSYTLTTYVHLINKQGERITPTKKIMLSRTVLLNANQVMTPETSSMAQRDMQREAIQFIYFWLISPQVQQDIKKNGK